MHCIKVRSHFPSSFYNEKIFLNIVDINSGVATNLQNKGLSVSQVEDWKITIPSFDLSPTIPLTIDKVYWEAYWQIVNKPASVVREVMINLENELKEKEKMVGNKQKLEKDEADKLERQKVQKQEELQHKKKRRIVESPTQLPLPNSQTTPLRKQIPNNELSLSISKSLQEVRLKERKKSSHHPLNHQFPTHLTLPLLQ